MAPGDSCSSPIALPKASRSTSISKACARRSATARRLGVVAAVDDDCKKQDVGMHPVTAEAFPRLDCAAALLG